MNIELITPDHHEVLQNDKILQWCILRENTFYLSTECEGSSYNATVAIKTKQDE
jgi:hypothetical protein